MKSNAEKREKFIVIFQQAIANDSHVGIAYSWDGEKFSDRQDAILHGFKTRGSDDFNIGVVKSERLAWFGWMDKQLDSDDETMLEIATAIDLKYEPAGASNAV